jgi:WD40 repeat protein
LELAGGKPGLKLSTQQLTLKRGDKTVVTVRREPPEPPQEPETASDLPPTGEPPALVEIARFYGHNDEAPSVVVSPDGRRILSGSKDRTMILWDRETGREIRRFKEQGGSIQSVAISPDGRRALSGSQDTIVRLWDLESGDLIREFRGHTEGVFSVAFSPDGRLAYSTSGGFLRGGWEDGRDAAIRVWDVETGQEVRRMEGHRGIVRSVAVSPDGRRVLSGGRDSAVILWDAEAGAEIRRFRGHTTDEVVCVAFLPDGRRAVSGGGDTDRTIRLWDVETGQEIHRFRGLPQGLTWLAVSPDGRRLLSSHWRRPELLLWDLEARKPIHHLDFGTVGTTSGAFGPDGLHAAWGGGDGAIRMYRLSAPHKDKAAHAGAPPTWPTGVQPVIVELAPFRGHDGSVQIAVVSPDGRRILSGSNDKTMILWDRETAQPIRRFKEHGGAIQSVAFAPDGRRAASGGIDKIVRLWDLESGDPIGELRGHSECVFGVTFSPDGRRLASCSGAVGPWNSTDSTVRLWDVGTRRELRQLEGHKGGTVSLAFSPDGRWLLSGGHDMTPILWDTETGAEVRRFRGHTADVRCVAFLPDGRRAVSCSTDRTIRLWDVESGQELHCFRGHRLEVTWVAVSPDGRWLLSTDYGALELGFWDVEARKLIHRDNWRNVKPTRGSFTPDGRHAVEGGDDGVIRMFRLTSPGQDKAADANGPVAPLVKLVEIDRFVGHNRKAENVAVSQDGRRILSASWDRTMILWDRETGRMIRRFGQQGGAKFSLAISPDGRRALSGGEDTVVRLWDLERGEVIREFRGHTGWVFCTAFSPDGRLAYSTSGGTDNGHGWDELPDFAIRVWDVETGRPVRRLEGHRGLVWSVAVSPDGRRILTGSQDRLMILWDAESGAEIRRFPGHTDNVMCVAFLPDGLRAISASEDRTIRLWDVQTGQDIHCMRGLTDKVTWLAISPDGRRLLSSSYNGRELLLWDLDTRTQIQCLDYGNVSPLRGCFTPDGLHAIWTGTDGVVRLYRLQPDDPSASSSTVYLCNLQETRSSIGFGALGKNGDLGYDPGNGDRRIIVKGVLAKKGLSMHATARGFSFARYQLDGKYTSFHSVAAANDSVRVSSRGMAATPMIFSVVGDGRELWKSRPIQRPGESQPCTVNVTGVRQLEVRVYCDEQGVAHAVWVDPHVQ